MRQACDALGVLPGFRTSGNETYPTGAREGTSPFPEVLERQFPALGLPSPDRRAASICAYSSYSPLRGLACEGTPYRDRAREPIHPDATFASHLTVRFSGGAERHPLQPIVRQRNVSVQGKGVSASPTRLAPFVPWFHSPGMKDPVGGDLMSSELTDRHSTVTLIKVWHLWSPMKCPENPRNCKLEYDTSTR